MKFAEYIIALKKKKKARRETKLHELKKLKKRPNRVTHVICLS